MTTRPGETLDVYKLAVEMADRVSARRGLANQFYLSIQTLILGVPAVFQAIGQGESADPLRSALLAFVGCIISVVWWLQLRSYRDLNTAKFEVINKLESDFFETRVFSDEWAYLKKDPVRKWRPRYAELGTVEQLVPWVFLAVNLTVLAMVWL